jgi:hypothetical protein
MTNQSASSTPVSAKPVSNPEGSQPVEDIQTLEGEVFELVSEARFGAPAFEDWKKRVEATFKRFFWYFRPAAQTHRPVGTFSGPSW